MGEDAGGPLVWARRDVALRTCPKPYITAESQTLVEEFLVRRRLRRDGFAELSARQVEAFVILEKALAARDERWPAQHKISSTKPLPRYRGNRIPTRVGRSTAAKRLRPP